MPFYEYRCGSCGHELEAMQKMSDAALTDCPACGRPALVKLVSAAGFRLKGGGWYETDFKGGSKKNVGDAAGGQASGGHSCGTGTCPACS
jgi:putative FmdB family regulatory protein